MSEENQARDQGSSGACPPGDLYRLFFEEAPNAMLATDREERVVMVNRRASILTGYSNEELLGRAIADLLSPENPGQEGASLEG